MENPNYILESSGSEENNGNNKDQKLESAKRVMGEVREENERLKLSLAHVASDDEESEFVSLSLGISPKGQHEKKNSNRSTQKAREDEDLNKGLGLGLDIRFDPYSADQIQSRCDEKRKEEELSEIWPPSKVLKTTKSGDKSEASQHTEPKKARVCIRARCDTHTMNDGCQWRKYGQKMAKGNPCPRAYYRCTVSPSCPVRKQVQRYAQDMSILITTYEGTHNHPLPNSATTIAYTTSAAASMLQSPSLTSQANSNTIPLINSLNFTSNIHQFSKPQQFYFHNSNSHPTITLDLTTPDHIENFTPSLSFIPKYSSTNFNFSSSTISPLKSTMPNQPWSPYNENFNNVGMITQNRNQIGSLMNSGKQPFQGHLYQPNYTRNYAFSPQPLLPDSIESAAITTPPNFQFALATALRTYVGNEGASGEVKENHVGAEGDTLKLNLGGDMPYTMNTVSTSKASSRYMRMSPSPNAPKGIFPSPQASKNNQFLDQWKSNNEHITPFDSSLSLMKRLDMVNNEEA